MREYVSWFIFLLFLLNSCRYAPSEKNKKDSEIDNPEFYELTEDIKDVFYRFPSPEEMFKFLDSTGLEFDKTILHEISSIDNYMNSLEQSLNLGIYTSDLAYITLFGKYKQSIDYLQAVYVLADKLHISDAIGINYMNRIDNNIHNFDSLKILSEKVYSDLSNYLSKNDQENIFAIISVGSFVEFMHIALSVSSDYSLENETIRRIGDQKLVFGNIVKFMHDFSDDENINKVLEIIKPLEDFYNKLPVEAQKTTVSKNKEGQVVFGGKKNKIMSKDEYNELIGIIDVIREKIISSKV